MTKLFSALNAFFFIYLSFQGIYHLTVGNYAIGFMDLVVAAINGYAFMNNLKRLEESKHE